MVRSLQLNAARSFPCAPSSVAAARRFVGSVLVDGGVAGDVAEHAMLAVSELATNALLHAGTPFVVTVARDGPEIRLDVHDGEGSPPQLRDIDPIEESGRGLHMVAAMARTWGVVVDPDGQGKSVWCILRDGV